MKPALLAFALLVGAGGSADDSADWAYRPSALQVKVDRSFSDIPIRTPFAMARLRLREERFGDCDAAAECDWLDRAGVRHIFREDSPGELFLAIKSVRAADFAARAIPALGIGTARDLRPVMEQVERFAAGARFDCVEEPTEAATCRATLDPGRVTINFDRRDRLVDVRFEGFHAT